MRKTKNSEDFLFWQEENAKTRKSCQICYNLYHMFYKYMKKYILLFFIKIRLKTMYCNVKFRSKKGDYGILGQREFAFFSPIISTKSGTFYYGAFWCGGGRNAPTEPFPEFITGVLYYIESQFPCFQYT